MKALLFCIGCIMTSAIVLFAQEKREVYLKGKVYTPFDTLVLLRSYEDARFQGIKIPTKADSTFDHLMEIAAIEAYQLIFTSELKRGAWRPINFFPDSDTILFELYPVNKFQKNQIVGSQLTSEQKEFYDVLITQFGKEMNYWIDKLNTKHQDSLLRIEAENKVDSIYSELFSWQHKYFSESPSLLGFYEYFERLKDSDNIGIKVNAPQDIHNFWVTQFADHPLRKRIDNYLTSKRQVIVGGSIVDFQITDNGDNSIWFSDLIKKSDYTLLDLWAPWCGPCIRKSIMVKENFKVLEAEDINVIGIIGGIKNLLEYETAKLKYKYPWNVYPEVNKEKMIWEKYGIPNAGGGQFLIDKSGKILAINPDIESILSIVKQ